MKKLMLWTALVILLVVPPIGKADKGLFTFHLVRKRRHRGLGTCAARTIQSDSTPG